MIGHRCRRCLWWDNQHVSVQAIGHFEFKPAPGFCRRRRPSAYMYEQNYLAIWPITDADEFCGEFKETT